MTTRTTPDFKFNLGAEVCIMTSDERGIVIARAEYTTSTNDYLIQYRAADGRAVEAWWREDAISLISLNDMCAETPVTETLDAALLIITEARAKLDALEVNIRK